MQEVGQNTWVSEWVPRGMSGSGLPTARLQGGEVLREVSLGHSGDSSPL